MFFGEFESLAGASRRQPFLRRLRLRQKKSA
jgi:hypothetical protein